MKQDYIFSKKDSRVYKSAHVALPSSIMAESRERPLTQPNTLLDSRFDFRKIQLSAIVKVTALLQPLINKNLSEYTTLKQQLGVGAKSILKKDFLLADDSLRVVLPYVTWNRDQKTLEVKLPIDSFTTIRSHYLRVRDALQDLTKIAVKYPQYSELAKKVLTDGQRSLCQSVFFSKDSKQQNRSYVHFFFREEIAQLLVNPCYGYSRLQPQTVDNLKSVSSIQIYMQICRFATSNKWAISYNNLRALLNLNASSVCRYSEFRRRIIDAARDELLKLAKQNQANYYFTYTEEFTAPNHQTPEFIIFHIYETAPSIKTLEGYANALKSMRYYACEILKIPSGQSERVLKKVSLRNHTYVFQRHIEIFEHISNYEKLIKNAPAYYLRSMENAIKEERLAHDQGAMQMQIKF